MDFNPYYSINSSFFIIIFESVIITNAVFYNFLLPHPIHSAVYISSSISPWIYPD